VDAQVVWLLARPVAERVPPAARVLTVTPVFGLNPDPRAARLDRAFTVNDSATVARIVAVVNGLTRFPDGAFSCPAESGGQMRLTFFTRPGGPVVSQLTAQYGGCGIVSVRIGGGTCPGSARTRGPARRCSSRCWPSRARAGRSSRVLRYYLIW
jgi:hypothetical protein